MGRYLDIVNKTKDRLTKTRSFPGGSKEYHANERNEENEGRFAEEAAGALLDTLLDAGAAFEVVRDRDRDVLLWFGPASGVTPDVMAKVSQYKPTIIRFLEAGHYPRSRRPWGDPSAQDWEEHPGHPSNGGA